MKAKTIDNSPYGFDTCIYDNDDYPMGYYVDDLPNKERADKYTNIFNSELSAHVAKETAPLLAEIDRLKKEAERLTKENEDFVKLKEALNEISKKPLKNFFMKPSWEDLHRPMDI